ncbi:MAG TPA: hypothetical protein VKV17_21485 [Bryobacteraceae bacterium]|nr:hypothetical protein [Bryobacteraceae bacterium]
MISTNRFASFAALAGLLIGASVGRAQTQHLYIAQIADGGLPGIQDWQTTLVITNTSSAASSITSMSFWKEVTPGNTVSWNLGFIEPEASVFPLNVPAGTTILLHTTATASVTSAGWADIAAGPGIQAYAIFTSIAPGLAHQDSTGVAMPAAARFLVPFDQTLSAAVGLAIANISNTSQTVNIAVKTTGGTTIQSSITIPALGHYNFPFNSINLAPANLTPIINSVSGQSGLMEIYTSTPSLAVLTLRFNATGAFTAAPVYAAAGPPIIGTAAGSTATPFSQLFVTGTWNLSLSTPSVLFSISPNGSGGYTAVAVSQQGPLLASFTNGTLSGQTLTFNTTGNSGLYGTSAITGGSLTLTVNDFDQVGSTVNGSLSVTTSGGTTIGSINGASTYQP